MSQSKSQASTRNFLPSDWKDHIAKTIITLVLGGLATLVVTSGTYLLNEDARLEKLSVFVASSKEMTARLKRRSDFCEAAVSAQQRAVKRSVRLTETLGVSKNLTNSNELRKEVEEGFQESAHDAGALAGYTPDSTGLPASFHESVNGFFKTELDLWQALDEISGSHQYDQARRLEIQKRSHSVTYAASLLLSSWQDMEKVATAQTTRYEELCQTMVAEAHAEKELVHLAADVLKLSTALFFVIILFLLLERLMGRKNQKFVE